MLPQIDGLAFTPVTGEEAVFNLPYSLDTAWNASEIYVLAWVQDMNTKQVYNSGTRFDLRATVNHGGGTATVAAAGGTPPYTYLWSTGATTATVNNLPPGMHEVSVTDSTGIFFSEALITNDPVALEPLLLQRLVTVYPNPTRDQLYVDLNGLEFHAAGMTLHDLKGSQVLAPLSLRSGETEMTIDVSGLPKGVYSLTIDIDGSQIKKKVTVLE
jgi:hypothetical protein